MWPAVSHLGSVRTITGWAPFFLQTPQRAFLNIRTTAAASLWLAATVPAHHHPAAFTPWFTRAAVEFTQQPTAGDCKPVCVRVGLFICLCMTEPASIYWFCQGEITNAANRPFTQTNDNDDDNKRWSEAVNTMAVIGPIKSSGVTFNRLCVCLNGLGSQAACQWCIQGLFSVSSAAPTAACSQ